MTPEQAEILSLASNETRIQLVLRNPLDTEDAKTAGHGAGASVHRRNAPSRRRRRRRRSAAPGRAPRVTAAAPVALSRAEAAAADHGGDDHGSQKSRVEIPERRRRSSNVTDCFGA